MICLHTNIYIIIYKIQLLFSIQSEDINECIIADKFGFILGLVEWEMSTCDVSEELTLKQQYLYLVRVTFLMLMGDFVQCHSIFEILINYDNIDYRVSAHSLIYPINSYNY